MRSSLITLVVVFVVSFLVWTLVLDYGLMWAIFNSVVATAIVTLGVWFATSRRSG